MEEILKMQKQMEEDNKKLEEDFKEFEKVGKEIEKLGWQVCKQVFICIGLLFKILLLVWFLWGVWTWKPDTDKFVTDTLNSAEMAVNNFEKSLNEKYKE